MFKIIVKYRFLFVIFCIVIILFIYIFMKGNFEMKNVKKEKFNFVVTSSAFDNDYILSKYTADGEDISIPLKFENIGCNGKTIAIIMDDPDAPSTNPFVHWLIWNIPTTITEIPENISTSAKVESLNGAIQGKNDFGKFGYKGPNPPSGIHNYRINVYVLDIYLNLDSNASRNDLENNMQDHIIESSLLEGKYTH